MAFRTWYNHFKYQAISFGLSNILANSQSYINKIFLKKLGVFVIEYFNNIMIYIKDSGPTYVNIVYCVFDQLIKLGLFAFLKKCNLYQDKVRFFSYVVYVYKVKIENKKIEAVQK